MENTALSLFPSDDLSDGLAQLRQELIEVRGEVLKPAPRLTGSKWVVEKRCKLSADNSSEPGLFRPFGFQNEWFDVFVDPKVKKVSIKKSARVGATRCACFGIGYFIEADPSLVMFVRPKDGDAEFFSKTEWAPTVRDNDFLAALKNPNTRGETQDTVMDKRYTNGAALMIRGAEAPDNLRGLTARIMFADEIDADGWKTGKGGGQGDKLDLVEKRGETFWNSKLICMSTPLKKGESLIEAEYLKGDQRKYFVPCPHCGEMQVLEFGGKDLPYGLKWEVDPESGLVVEAYYVCAHNGCIIQESSKPWMIDSGEWRPTAKPKEAGHVSYHIWTAYSLFPKAAWKNIAQAFVNAQSNPHEKLQPFVNLWLGESWEDRAVKTVSPENLQERAEPYEAEVPQGVAYLTAGIDTQDNRLEVEIVGWGRGEESWSVD
jgi:phage terminase large subunit GpA-like protein